MKRTIYLKYMLIFFVSIQFFGCSKDEWELPTLDQEFPRILSNWPPKTANGLPGEFNVRLGQEFRQEIIYTPTNKAECIWYLEGVEVASGAVLTFNPTETGKYYIKVIVKTKENQTFREAYLSVINP